MTGCRECNAELPCRVDIPMGPTDGLWSIMSPGSGARLGGKR